MKIKNRFYLSPRLRWLRRLLGVRLKRIALAYCDEHPETKKFIAEAGRRSQPTTLLCAPFWVFEGGEWVTRCHFCGKIVPDPFGRPHCTKSIPDIASIVLSEEEKFEKVLQQAEVFLNKEAVPLDGTSAAILTHTHGVPNDMFLPMDKAAHFEEDFKREMAMHRALSPGKKPKTIGANP